KEENAKTTVQNYVFSRVLKDEYGSNIIQKGDTVLVVSNHWHAVSVAARLRKHDAVHAKFFIEGDISPKENDKFDYVSIFNGELDNDKFISNALWLTPQASWQIKDNTYYLMDSLVYETNDRKVVITSNRLYIFHDLRLKDNTYYLMYYLVYETNDGKVVSTSNRSHVFNDPRFKDNKGAWSFIENGNTWFIKVSDKIYVVDKSNMKIKNIFSWDNFVYNMP